ncbi:MAG: hypothetical protein M1296_01295 [Chloroflexi bacterium]|nr:hypothetical protein [Chloroflexota bacterium]
MDSSTYVLRIYRVGLTRQLRAEVVSDGRVLARATISGEGPPEEAIALARKWAENLGYPTPEPQARKSRVEQLRTHWMMGRTEEK